MRMLSSNIVLGIKAFLSDLKYTHGILKQEWDWLPCGTPIVYPAEDNIKRKTTVLTLMTPTQASGGRSDRAAEVRGDTITPVNLKPLCDNHKVMPISEFDFDKLPRLLQFIRDVGGISLSIEPESGRRKMIDVLRKISETFKLSSLFYFNHWGSKHLEDEDDKYVCVLTFLDLPYCIPIFNSRKVDGIGLSLVGTTLNASVKYGRLNKVFIADFIFSNYEDNAFVVDGVVVNQSTSGSDIVLMGEIGKLAALEMPIAKKKEASSMAEWYSKHIDTQELVSEWKSTKVKSEWNKLVGNSAGYVGHATGHIHGEPGLAGPSSEWQSISDPTNNTDETIDPPSDEAPPDPDDSPIVEIIHNGESLIEFDTTPWEEESNLNTDNELDDDF